MQIISFPYKGKDSPNSASFRIFASFCVSPSCFLNLQLLPLGDVQRIPILPVLRVITWEDGKRYEIDWVIDIRQAPAMKAGGQEIGIRYKYTGKDGIYSLSAAQIRPEAIWDDGLQRRISSLHN